MKAKEIEVVKLSRCFFSSYQRLPVQYLDEHATMVLVLKPCSIP
jgi:hypothetical protein